MIAPSVLAPAVMPLDDPQFWIATGLVVAAGALALSRVVRTLRAERESPCAGCPQARHAVRLPLPAARPPGSARAPRRLPVLPAALALALLAAPAAAATVERRLATMGTTLTVRAEAGDPGAARAAIESAVRAIEAAERRLSTWRDDSELAAIGRAPVGAAIELSPETAAALAGALDCARETGGAFDPTVAPLVAAWGLRSGGRVPGGDELDRALSLVGAGRIAVDLSLGRARKLAPVELEEGGFGKGAALDDALDAARTESVTLDLGGQHAWRGAPPRALALADPRDRARAAFELDLAAPPVAVAERGSLASSGNSERGLVVEGRPLGHLLDPRTGRPAAEFGSVAVLDPSALRADCLSTALYVLGPARGLEWMAAHGAGAEAVFLVVEGERLVARATPGLAGRLRPAGAEAIAGVPEVEKGSS